MKTAILMAMVLFSIPMTAFSSCNYPCEIDNPDESQRWAVPCVNAPEGTAIPGIFCKECDGDGGERNKPDGTEVDINGTPAFCCGGVLYFIGPKPDGCYEVVDCEWRQYTPDCSDEDANAYNLFQQHWSALQHAARAMAAAEAMQLECDLGTDPRYIGPPQNRDWMRESGQGDPCAAADWWREEEARRDERCEDLRIQLEEAETQLDDCNNCRD